VLGPPVGEKEWRADFDVFAYGYYAGKAWRFINQLGRTVGLSLLEPVRYSKRSDVVTKSVAEILDRAQKRWQQGVPLDASKELKIRDE
jgi:hypothetical protein